MPWHPCVNSRDTITQDEGVVLQNFRSLGDQQHTVTSHCRDANGTWVTWFDDLADDTWGAGFNDISTYTGNDFPIHVAYFPDDGSAATVYDLAVGYIWNWKALGRYSNVSSCAIHGPGTGSRYFGNNVQCELVGWNVGVLDVQVRSDGTNVWVAALAQESVMYPSLSNTARADRCGITHLSILQDALGEGLTLSTGLANPSTDGSAHDHDTTGDGSIPGGGTWWQQSGVVGVDEPDDAGEHSSFRWQPARVTVWAGDLGGFTKLGAEDAQFNNSSGNAAKGIGLCSGIEVAASPSQPGVCHVLWAEAGGYGYEYDTLGQRISYSQWDAGAPVMQTDIASRSEANPEFDSLPFNGYLGEGLWAWTAEMILRNDHGAPCAIIAPWEITASDTSGVTGGPLAPSYYDLSSGSAILVQTMDESLYPTETEAGITSPVTFGGRLISQGGSIDTSSDPHRVQFASSLYTDPLYTIPDPAGGTIDLDVYLFSFGFNVDIDGTRVATAFYRIPVDGSQTFDFMDGTRLSMYSILPRDTATNYMTLAAGDFVSDPGNVWIPAPFAAETDAGIKGGGGVLHLPRTCTRTWELLPGFPPLDDPSAGDSLSGAWVRFSPGVEAPTSPPAIVTDGSGNDWLVAGGQQTPPPLAAPTVTPGALWARICRCCVPCIERIGLHIWEKV